MNYEYFIKKYGNYIVNSACSYFEDKGRHFTVNDFDYLCKKLYSI